MVDVVFQTVKVVLNNRDQALIICPVKFSTSRLASRTYALKHVAFGDANEREHFVNVGKPENAGNDGILALRRLKTGNVKTNVKYDKSLIKTYHYVRLYSLHDISEETLAF